MRNSYGSSDVCSSDLNIYALLALNFYATNTCHNFLTLPLLLPRVRANDTNHAFALNDLAILAKLFDRRSYFHINSVSRRCALSKNRTASSPKSQPGDRQNVVSGKRV